MILLSSHPFCYFPRRLPPLVPGALRLAALHRGAPRGRRRRASRGAAPSGGGGGCGAAAGAGAGDATAPGGRGERGGDTHGTNVAGNFGDN